LIHYLRCTGGASRAERDGHDLSGFPHVRRWLETVLARPAVKRGLSVKVEAAFHVDLKDPKVRAVLFNQRARSLAGRIARANLPRLAVGPRGSAVWVAAATGP